MQGAETNTRITSTVLFVLVYAFVYVILCVCSYCLRLFAVFSFSQVAQGRSNWSISSKQFLELSSIRTLRSPSSTHVSRTFLDVLIACH